MLLVQVLLNLLKEHWPVALHNLDLVHEHPDVRAGNHLDTELCVYSLELSDLVQGILKVPQVIRIGQLMRALVLVQVKELEDAELANLVHKVPLLVLVDLDLVQIHVLRSCQIHS